MAITREDFENIPSSGVIPADRLPASGFAVSYAFTYTGTPSLSTFNHTFSGKIVLHFKDSTDFVKYVVEIEQTYNLFIFPLAPGLVLYTWNWVPTSEKISGRKGEDPDALPMATLGEATFGVEPAEGSGTTDFEVIVDSRFYSGIFQERLSPGDQIKIVFHNLSAGFVVNRASLSLATERLLRMLDTVRGHFGDVVAARPRGGDAGAGAIQGGHSWPFHKRLAAHGFIRNATDPSLVMLPDGREILGVLQPGGYFEYESFDTQRTWSRVRYPVAGSLEKAEAAIFDGDATVPLLVLLGDNVTRLALEVSGGAVFTRRVGDDGLGVRRRVPGLGAGSYALTVDDAGAALISDETGLPKMQSLDGGLNWTPVTTSEGGE